MYRGLISLMPKSLPLLLNLYPNASVAYSLRKLRTAYTGSAIRVRRSSDNTEQDIGFVGNDLDTTSLLSFVGTGNGFVVRWYDQSGNNRNSIQGTATSQCQIVASGAVILDPINNRISTLWTNDRYNFTFFALNANNRVSSVFVFNRTSGNIVGIGSSNNTQADSFKWLSINDISSFGNSSNGTNSGTGCYISFTQRLANSTVNLWLNGNSGMSGTSTANAGPNSFGQSSAVFNSGYFQEIVLWSGNDWAGEENNISNLINNYYGIY